MTFVSRRIRSIGLVALAFSIFGCGGGSNSPEIAVQGKITLDGSPLDQASIRFLPNATGNGGSGLSKADGTFTIIGPQGQNGVIPGQYKVTVSRRVNPDGSVPPPDEDMMISKAVEKLPPSYSDQNRTTLKTEVQKDGIVELKLTKSAKR